MPAVNRMERAGKTEDTAEMGLTKMQEPIRTELIRMALIREKPIRGLAVPGAVPMKMADSIGKSIQEAR